MERRFDLKLINNKKRTISAEWDAKNPEILIFYEVLKDGKKERLADIALFDHGTFTRLELCAEPDTEVLLEAHQGERSAQGSSQILAFKANGYDNLKATLTALTEDYINNNSED